MGFISQTNVYYYYIRKVQTMDILGKIDEMRKARGWSMYMLALEAGITQSTLLNMYSRKTQPSIKTLTAICQAFGITLSEFFADGKEHAEGIAQNDELLRRIRTLGSEERDALLVIVKAMTDR